MKFSDLAPHLLSIAAFIFGVWQFVINRTNKKKEKKFDTYIRFSELISSYQNEFDRFLLSLRPHLFHSLTQELLNGWSLLETYEINMKSIGSNTELITEKCKSDAIEIQNIESETVAREFINLHKSQIEKFEGEIKYWEEQLLVSRENLQNFKVLLNKNREQHSEEFNKIKIAFMDLSVKLDEYLLGFNKIGDMQLFASKKVNQQVTNLKAIVWSLKMWFDNSIKSEFNPQLIVALTKSAEWKNFKDGNEILLRLMKKEM